MSAPDNLRSGERRTATVLFADMKDFTALSERMDPEEMDGLMNQVFGVFESIVRRYDGTVEKYIGDALVAVFGVPTLHEDDPARAINAALEFIAHITRLNDRRANREAIAFRIGINTGLIATGRRGDHDVVTGHAVAVASRLETSAEPNTILVSATTRERCEAEFVFSDPIAVQARGKDGQITAYQVRSVSAGSDDDDTVFVGRRLVLDRMLRSFLRHDPTRTDGFMLAGEAGIGKTRTAREFLRKVNALPDFGRGVLHARARRYGRRSFAVVMDLLTGYFEIDPGTPPERIVEVMTKESGVDERTAESFASLIGGEGDEQENQAFVVLYLILKSVVKLRLEAPYTTLLCVDDAQFMDRSSIDFFRFYLRNADARPFFLLLDRSPGAVREVFADLELIEMQPLSRDEVSALIMALEPTRLDADVIKAISESSEGNPLFVREYVRYARENRDVQTLPATIQNIFLTSVESYEPGLRDLLRKLSVFVHSFSMSDAEHLQRSTDGEPQMVPAAVSLFLRDGILVQDDELFMFRHDLFKIALYNSLLNYNKKILHRVVSDLMECKGNPNTLRLLHHLLRCEQYDRAAEALQKAENCTSNMDYLPIFDQLREHIRERDFDRYMRLMFLKSALLFNNGISDEADSLLKGIIETAVSRRSHLYAGSAYHLLTAYNMKSYSFQKAHFCGTKAVAHYTRVGQGSYNLQNVLEIMAVSEFLRNNQQEVNRIVDRIRALEHDPDSRFSSTRLAGLLAEHHLMRGEYRAGTEVLRQALDGMEERSETWYLLRMLLALARFYLCDWRTLTTVDPVVLEGPLRHYSNISQTHARLAVGHHFLGESDRAEQRLQQAEFTTSQIRNDFDRVDAYRTLAGCYLLRNDLQNARRYAEQGLTTGLRHSATYPVFSLLITLATVSHAENDPAGAGFFLDEAELLAGSGVLVSNRDLMLYHYYRGRLDDDEQDRAGHRKDAAGALRRELAAIADPDLTASFLAIPIFERVHQELLGEPLAAQGADQPSLDSATPR